MMEMTLDDLLILLGGKDVEIAQLRTQITVLRNQVQELQTVATDRANRITELEGANAVHPAVD